MTTHKEQKGESLEDCPSNDFEQGTPNGYCWGDGHYQCKDCIHYRADFKRGGQEFIDFVHTYQNGITVHLTHI